MKKTPSLSVTSEAISFRHPIVKDGSGLYGKVIRKGIVKFSHKELAEIKESLETLLERKPLKVEEIQSLKLHEKAVEWFFSVMPSEADELFNYEQMMKTQKNPLNTFSGSSLEFLGIIEQKNNEIERLKSALESLQNALGIQSEENKKLTLSDCFEHFKASFSSSTVAATREILHNVEVVLSTIGQNTKYSEVTRQSLENAVKALVEKSESMRLKRAKHAKTFFAFLSRPVNEGGKNLQNPATNMKLKAVKVPQSQQGEMINPKDIFAQCDLTLAQKALIGLMGYANLRASEAAGLEWKDVEWDMPVKDRIIYIRPNAVRTTLKTEDSWREVKPFPNLWPILEAYKAAEGSKNIESNPMMFYRDADKKTTWINFEKGRTNSNYLGKLLNKIVKSKIAIKTKLNFALRHFWTTKMELSGNGDTESLMGGHSKAIADKHYLNKIAKIRALNLEEI